MKNAKIMDFGRPGPAPNSNMWCIFFAFFEIGVSVPFQIALFSTFFFAFSEIGVSGPLKIALFGTFFCIFRKWCFGAFSELHYLVHFFALFFRYFYIV